MALAIASGFLLQSTAPNFERDMFSTVAEMKSYPDASLPDVFVSTCVEDGCVYCYNRTNEVLETTGKWRKVGSGDSNIWIGTTAEYDAAATLGTIPVGTLVFITDDTADGADTGIIYDTELSATSENAVTNKAIKEALDKKVDIVDGKGLSTYDFDDTAYNKLDGIQAGANKTVCDTTIQTSNNPVTNTAIKTALEGKVDTGIIQLKTITVPANTKSKTFNSTELGLGRVTKFCIIVDDGTTAMGYFEMGTVTIEHNVDLSPFKISTSGTAEVKIEDPTGTYTFSKVYVLSIGLH